MRLIGDPFKRRPAERGQALVEFSLVIPIFMVIFLAIAEFAFVLTTKTGVTNASQDAVQLAAELGNSQYADTTILQLVESDISSPLDKNKIYSVEIVWTDSYGTVNNAEDMYRRTGSNSFPDGSATGVTLPYTPGTATYPATSRCNHIAGCGPGKPLVDYIAVIITYKYTWITPLPNFVGFGSSPPTFVQTSISRLEPIQ
jgi:Flp pilus assembly protein TadG